MLMFFGVMMMQSGWYNVDVTLCMLTVGGIGLMIYCLADVDQTHTGLMRIPVDRLDDLDFVGNSSARSSFKFSDSLRVATAFRLPRIRNAFMKAGGAGQLPSPTGGDADDEVIKAAGSVTSSVRWAGPIEGGSALPMSYYGDAGRRNSSLFASVQKFSLPPQAAAVAAAAAITAERGNYQPLNNNANFMECELTDAYEGEHHRVIDIHPSSEAPSRSPSASSQQRSRLKYGEDAVVQRPFGRTDRDSARLANEPMNGEVSLDSGFTPTSASLPGSC
uniref:Uncharacterized protein n=1 Tax=Tetraselmis chuii TaxID=63592 RepID=A0A7S1X5Y0_9CHLO